MNTTDLIKEADRAVSALYDGLKKTVPGFKSIEISYMTVPTIGKTPSTNIHTDDCDMFYNIDDLAQCIQSKKYKKHWGTL